MKEKFDLLLNEYLKDESTVVNSNKAYYIEFVKNMPEYLYKYFDKDKYLVKASVGAGQKSEIPWVCIFNRKITTSATQGIYICYLFKSDMSGFYLVLGQGITTFTELYGVDKYKNIKKVAEYFRNLINDKRFSTDPIDLKGTKELAKGYEQGTIISKYYAKTNYSERELLEDLMDFKEIYEGICENMMDSSYMDIVNNVVNQMDLSYVAAEEAKRIIEKTLIEEKEVKETQEVTLEKVNIPKYRKKNRYAGIAKRTNRKVDYIKKAKTNAKNGLLGEELVMTYEKERLINLGRKDLAEKIRWISKEDDGTGYDIISFDVDEFGEVQEKYIEVKTTEENDMNAFYISVNELKVMEKLKSQYYIYRIYNLKTRNPKVFILGYQDFKNKIDLAVESYVANIKRE